MADIEELIGQINNEFDLETSSYDDDPSFGAKSSATTGYKHIQVDVGVKDPEVTMATDKDGKEYEVTGIVVNFDDDEEIPVRKAVKVEAKSKIDANFKLQESNEDVNQIYNDVDMETYCYDDDDDELVSRRSSHKELNFDDDDEFDFTQELVLAEKKSKPKKVSTGEVEDDYWEKLKKKHQKTNVKGAAPYHLRVGHFDPEREAELLNHDLTPNGNPFKNNTVVSAVDTNFDYGDLGDIASDGGEGSTASGDVGSTSGTASAASVGGESLEKNQYTKLFESLIDMIGFRVTKKSNDSYLVEDLYTAGNAFNCRCTKEIVERLDNYIRDFTILGLKESTGNKMDSYKDWSEWYNEENRSKYPTQKRDIEYCDLIANHLGDVKF